MGNASDDLASELRGLGAVVEVVPNVQDLSLPENSELLVFGTNRDWSFREFITR